MKTEAERRDDGSWNLWVNGRLALEGESYTVVMRVQYALHGPYDDDGETLDDVDAETDRS